MVFNPPQLVCVKRSPGKGRGVFAKQKIAKGDVIERSPIIIIPYTDLSEHLQLYCYDADGRAAIGCGYLSFYNHSRKSNATQYIDGPSSIQIVAKRNIKAGEEITINYGACYANQKWY